MEDSSSASRLRKKEFDCAQEAGVRHHQCMEVENPSQSSSDTDDEWTLSGLQVEKQELPESTQDAVVELSDRLLRSRKRGPPPPLELEHPGHSSSDDEWKLDGGTLTTVELEGCAVLRPPKIGKTSWDSCLCCSMSGGI